MTWSRSTNRPDKSDRICISVYEDEVQSLDGMVDELNGRGVKNVNRSSIIRFALSKLDLGAVPEDLHK